MRFEIRAGGAFLILIGLAGLSGVVFALGLVAGYQMARQTSPDTSQVASVYPLPNAPESQPSQAASPAEANAAPSPAASSQLAVKTPPKPAPAAVPSVAAPAPVAQPAPKVAKAVAPPPTVPRTTEDEAGTGSAIDHGNRGERTASAPAPARHKPYNIQIDAVMDRTNAANMASKLQRLGYRAYLVPTEIGDQTWWRVRVGPYDTQEEAAAAEQELRTRYRMSYPRQ